MIKKVHTSMVNYTLVKLSSAFAAWAGSLDFLCSETASKTSMYTLKKVIPAALMGTAALW